MTDSINDDDLVDTTTTRARRPMYIETEVRTDTITKRRIESPSLSQSRSVYDVLKDTKSPTDGLPPTTYTYAHSVSYMPVTQNGNYEVPVMARRDLHADSYTYGSTSYSSNTSAFASPTRIITNVRSQLANGYSAIRNRLSHHQQSAAPILNSPSRSLTARHSQSSSNGASTTYNLRRRQAPVHSTPREAGYDQSEKGTSESDSQENKKDDENNSKDHQNFLVRILKRIVRAPFDLLGFFVHKLFALPWWLLLPLLLFLGFYAFPNLVCKPLEHYPESKLYQHCQHFQDYSHNVTHKTMDVVRHYTYDRSVENLKGFYHTVLDVKNSTVDSVKNVYYRVKNLFRRSVHDAKEKLEDTVDVAKQNVQQYCDAGLQKVNELTDQVKEEIKKYSGKPSALSPEKEAELRQLILRLVDEYTADETGQADYALEANGAKVVDTKCTEYTDEPRQNVVKFLGIPIVHMSKQPDIMIKAGRLPGQCFPFKGDKGSVVIKLAVPVKPTEFVLEHLSKNLSIVGHINSAPNNFTVYALKDKSDSEGKVLGHYFYDAENGPALQRFKPQLPNVPVVEYIEIRVSSNWGNPNYTCLYRFRVHGDLKSVVAPATAA